MQIPNYFEKYCNLAIQIHLSREILDFCLDAVAPVIKDYVPQGFRNMAYAHTYITLENARYLKRDVSIGLDIP